MSGPRASIVLVSLLALAAVACQGIVPNDPNAPETAAAEDLVLDPPAAEPPAPPKLPPVVAGSGPASTYPPEMVARGRKLVTIGACNDCHTPWAFDPDLGSPAPDMTRMLSGHPAGVPGPSAKPGPDAAAVMGATMTSFAMPFGTVLAPNLTPDTETGLGSWTEEMFVSVFRTGTHMGGGTRPVLPPMPWPNLAALDREELVSIYAYLRSIPPIRNGVATFNPPPEMQDGMRKTNEKILQRIHPTHVARVMPEPDL